jgi:hypothetical protein
MDDIRGHRLSDVLLTKGTEVTHANSRLASVLVSIRGEQRLNSKPQRYRYTILHATRSLGTKN